MFDAEAPIVMPCGCYHDIDRGILHQCPVHLQEDEDEGATDFSRADAIKYAHGCGYSD